jgi:hypothetical protein
MKAAGQSSEKRVFRETHNNASCPLMWGWTAALGQWLGSVCKRNPRKISWTEHYLRNSLEEDDHKKSTFDQVEKTGKVARKRLLGVTPVLPLLPSHRNRQLPLWRGEWRHKEVNLITLGFFLDFSRIRINFEFQKSKRGLDSGLGIDALPDSNKANQSLWQP